MSEQADNVTMSGGGLYSLATLGAKHVIDKTIPRVLEALEATDSDQAIRSINPYTFSDMGCADGGTSLELWRSVISQLRNRKGDSSQNDVHVVYADQPNNDFNALAKITHGLTEFKTYLNEFDNVFVSQSGASFYTPILPKESLDLGFSATAMHWLRGKPSDISDHIHMVGARGDELDVFAKQASKDWETILLHRARELKPGGRLVLVNFCRDEAGGYLGATNGVNMFDTFNGIWQQFVDDGVVTAQEYQAMTLPQYYNTVEEFSAPFEDTKSDVYQAGLRLESVDTARVACPFAEDFKTHGDAKRFAGEYLPTIRSWNESTFLGGLSSTREVAERLDIIENYYATYQALVEKNPDQHRMDYVHAYKTICKLPN